MILVETVFHLVQLVQLLINVKKNVMGAVLLAMQLKNVHPVILKNFYIQMVNVMIVIIQNVLRVKRLRLVVL